MAPTLPNGMTSGFNVGYGVPTQPLDQTVLSDSSALLQQLHGQITSHLSDQVNQVAQTHQGTIDAISGFLAQKMDKVNEKLQKPIDKITSHLVNEYSNLANAGIQVGVAPVGPEDLPPSASFHNSQGIPPSQIAQQYPPNKQCWKAIGADGSCYEVCADGTVTPCGKGGGTGSNNWWTGGGSNCPPPPPGSMLSNNWCNEGGGGTLHTAPGTGGGGTNGTSANNCTTPTPTIPYAPLSGWCGAGNNPAVLPYMGTSPTTMSYFIQPGSDAPQELWGNVYILAQLAGTPFPAGSASFPMNGATMAEILGGQGTGGFAGILVDVCCTNQPPTGNNNNNNNNNNYQPPQQCIPICGMGTQSPPTICPDCPPCSPTICPPPPAPSYVVAFNCVTGQTLILPADIAQDLPDANWQLMGSYSAPTQQDLANQIASALPQAMQGSQCGLPPDPLPQQQLDCMTGAWANMMVGSPEWCALLDDITKAFSQLGQQLLSLLVVFDILGDGNGCQDAATDKLDLAVCPIEDNIASQIGGSVIPDILPGSDLVKGIVSAIFGTSGNIGSMTEIVSDVVKGMAFNTMQSIGFDKSTACKVATDLDPGFLVKYLRETMCSIMTGVTQCSVCNPVLLSGLCFLKGLLGFLRHLRGDVVAGLSFIGKCGIKIAFHLPVEIKPVEHVIDILISWSCPTRLPSEGEVRELALRQEIDQVHYSTLTQLHGLSPWFAGKLLHAKREKLSHHDIIEYYRRHPELQDHTDDKLKQVGFIDDTERGMIEDLYNEIPEIQTHFEWLRRNADSPMFVAQFGLWQGFDARENIIAFYEQMLLDPSVSVERKAEITEAIPIISSQIINPALATRNYWNTYGTDIVAKGWTYKNAFYAYVAHFLPVPREMGYEFVQRLRPNRVDPELVFTIDTLRRVLNEQDIDPNMIDRYIACSYRTVNQRYIAMLSKQGLWDEAEVAERLQDIGFRPQDAQTIAHGLEFQKRQQVATEFHGWTAANMIEAYKEGVADEDLLREGLKYLGATDAVVDETIQVAGLLHKHKEKNEYNNAIKKGYLRGLYDDATALNYLLQSGVEQTQAAKLISLWQFERSVDIHNPTVQELANSVIQGWLSIDDFTTRLVRMNYSSDSISYQVSTILMKQQKQLDKDFALLEKEKLAIAKAIQQQIDKALKAKKLAARITLNIAKAQEKASMILMKDSMKETAAYAKQLLKLQTSVGLASAKDASSRQLLAIAQDAKAKITAIRNQLGIDKATTTDKMAHAQMQQAANDKILAIEQQAQAQAEQVKQQLASAQTAAANTLTLGPQPPSIPTSGQVAATEASVTVSNAVATGIVDAMPT